MSSEMHKRESSGGTNASGDDGSSTEGTSPLLPKVAAPLNGVLKPLILEDINFVFKTNAWVEFLNEIQKEFPNAAIAGGVLRDDIV